VLVSALPFAIIAAISVSGMVSGPGWGLLPLLAVGPAVAAAVGGLPYTRAADAAALAVCLLFALDMQPGATHRMTEATFLAVAGVTAADALANGPAGAGTGNWRRSGGSPKPPSRYCCDLCRTRPARSGSRRVSVGFPRRPRRPQAVGHQVGRGSVRQGAHYGCGSCEEYLRSAIISGWTQRGSQLEPCSAGHGSELACPRRNWPPGRVSRKA
jgi:hypothetical protein